MVQNQNASGNEPRARIRDGHFEPIPAIDYYCLKCLRDMVQAVAAGHIHLTAYEAMPRGRIAECVVCGCPLPESKKRELKAENLYLRLQLLETRNALDAAESRAASYQTSYEALRAISV